MASINDDIIYRISNIPILVDLIVGGIFTGVMWWYWYKIDLKKEFKKGIERTQADQQKLISNANKRIDDGIKEGNVGKVVMAANTKIVAAQSFGPVYALGAMIQNWVERK